MTQIDKKESPPAEEEKILKKKPGRPPKAADAKRKADSEKDSLSPPVPTASASGPAKIKKKNRYWQGIGRRKEATAVIRLYTGGSDIIVNGKQYTGYFPILELQKIVESPLRKMKLAGKFLVEAKVSGGGIRSQAEALRLALARALVSFNPEFRKRLRRAGYLTRDPRVKERKKYGLKKARRAPQWQKR